MTPPTRRNGSKAIDIVGPVAYMHADDVGKAHVPASKRPFLAGVQASYEAESANDVKVIMATDDFIMFEAFRAKGSIDVAHIHADHYAIVYLKKGRIKLRLGNQYHIVEEGDTCYHAVGMLHQHEALEDSIRIETKVYPKGGAIQAWNKLLNLQGGMDATQNR